MQIGKILGVPEKILKKAPSDGISSQTDEEKMGIKYSQISEMIEKGDTDDFAKNEIIKRYNASKHKREKVPIYEFERENYLKRNEGDIQKILRDYNIKLEFYTVLTNKK